MYAFLLSVSLLGQYDDGSEYRRQGNDSTHSPLVQDLLREQMRSNTEYEKQRREAASQTYIATSNQDEDMKQTYIIAGSIVGGLILLGLISRSGKK
jgi:hypothetical protein